MSPSLPVVSGRELVAALQNKGFVVVRQTGSHIILRRGSPFAQVTVPNHKTLDRGTLRAILRGASLSVEELVELH